jgi:hypothetical protein
MKFNFQTNPILKDKIEKQINKKKKTWVNLSWSTNQMFIPNQPNVEG